MSPSSALANSDILYEVFQHLSVYPDHNEDLCVFESRMQRNEELKSRRNALASAAQTCKAFSELAYDILWAVLPGIIPLLSIFSGYRIEEYQAEGRWTRSLYTAKRHIVDGDISPSEWERFDRLSKRVRCLTCGYDEIAGPFLHLLASRYDPSSLCPQLRFLIWRESLGDTGKLRILGSLCASPNLSVFMVWNSKRHTFGCVDEDLSVVSAACPDLPHIRAGSYALGVNAEQVLTTFRNLRSVRLEDISDALLRHLATLPRLEELHANWTKSSSASTSAKNVPFATGGFPALRGGFPALRHLEIAVMLGMDGGAAVLRVLSAVSSISLSSLSVSFQDRLSAEALRCVEGLGSLPACVSLRRLDMDMEFDPDDDDFQDGGGTPRVEIVMFSDFLRPLLHLRTLEDITLDIGLGKWFISDEDIGTMTNAWPHLIRLSIRDNTTRSVLQPDGVPIIPPSLDALVAFAQSCRTLRILDVEVADVSEDELVRLEARVAQIAPLLSPQTTLQTITFARSHNYRKRIVLPDIDRLARALHALFPCLGGLGDPIKDTGGMEGRLRYHGWPPDMMDSKLFRFLETMEKLKRVYLYTEK